MAKMELDIAEMVEKTFEKHFGVTLDRLRELAEADKDGRCVVLPCKVGDTVWVIQWNIKTEDFDVVTTKVKNVRCDLCDGAVSISDGDYIRTLGKTAFLTREAAEKALEATK